MPLATRCSMIAQQNTKLAPLPPPPPPWQLSFLWYFLQKFFFASLASYILLPVRSFCFHNFKGGRVLAVWWTAVTRTGSWKIRFRYISWTAARVGYLSGKTDISYNQEWGNCLLKLVQETATLFPLAEILVNRLRLSCSSLILIPVTRRATRWRSWLRHCATSRKVAGSIPDGIIRIFHWNNPSGCTKALGSNQPLTEMSTRNISWR